MEEITESKSQIAYFSNHSVRFVVCRIILRRLGELISLSSFVHTLPTSSDGCTALQTDKKNQEEHVRKSPFINCTTTGY